jgi:hypothetical protein
MIHLADLIFVLGPSYMHYRYQYEHHMVVMKGYVRNHAHPEGSMIEGYRTEEVAECYGDYINNGRLSGKGIKGAKSIIDATYKRVCEAHFSIMDQLAVMRPYIEKHLQELHNKNQDKDLIMK